MSRTIVLVRNRMLALKALRIVYNLSLKEAIDILPLPTDLNADYQTNYPRPFPTHGIFNDKDRWKAFKNMAGPDIETKEEINFQEEFDKYKADEIQKAWIWYNNLSIESQNMINLLLQSHT